MNWSSARNRPKLRVVAGLSPESAEAAALGLSNTIFGITILRNGGVVGTGRLIGDGGLFFSIVDIAVEPGHQGRGLGKAIMNALVEHVKSTAKVGADISLIAAEKAGSVGTRNLV
jgi:ribosomal protein S18 acetylase RimI-like enzyme